jgi:hypothetical protein
MRMPFSWQRASIVLGDFTLNVRSPRSMTRKDGNRLSEKITLFAKAPLA